MDCYPACPDPSIAYQLAEEPPLCRPIHVLHIASPAIIPKQSGQMQDSRELCYVCQLSPAASQTGVTEAIGADCAYPFQSFYRQQVH